MSGRMTLAMYDNRWRAARALSLCANMIEAEVRVLAVTSLHGNVRVNLLEEFLRDLGVRYLASNDISMVSLQRHPLEVPPRNDTHPKIVVCRNTELQYAEPQIPRILRQETLHALEQRHIEDHRVHGLFSHHWQGKRRRRQCTHKHDGS